MAARMGILSVWLADRELSTPPCVLRGSTTSFGLATFVSGSLSMLDVINAK